MIKFTGLALIFSCSALWGLYLARQLQARAALLQVTVDFFRQFEIQLRCSRASPATIVCALARQSAFAQAEPFQHFAKAFETSNDFAANLGDMIRRFSEFRENGSAGLLLPLGDAIGVQDIELQLSALDSTLLLLEKQLADSEKAAQKYGGLYKKLGVLCGLLLVVVMI